jgi:hypothetical protein
VNLSPDNAMELGQLLLLLDDWFATDHGPVNESLTASSPAFDAGRLVTGRLP